MTQPELFGAYEAAEALGVRQVNLRTVKGLPAPYCKLRATTVWLADDIRRFADERREAAKARAAAAEQRAAEKAQKAAERAAKTKV